MYKINYKEPIHIHFIGIGGISMSGLAEILLKEGFTISGSDSKESSITEHLQSLGAIINIGQKASNITDNIDLVVYTAAIHKDNPEYAQAVRVNKPMMTRAQLLGDIMTNYNTSVAISGTHGKTTTTSMLTYIFLAAKKDPTISVGGILDAIGGNIRVGNSQYFVTEACEYTNSFLSFNPQISIILNVEEDHLDFFSGIDDIINSFTKFAQKLPENGTLAINGDMDSFNRITNSLSCNIVTFGLNPTNKYTATDITYDELGNVHYSLTVDKKVIGRIDLQVNGQHNIMNSLAAIAIAMELDIDIELIKSGLLAFTGTKRRFEYKGELEGFKIFDDYAHHPTEIKATLTAANRYPHSQLWCVFQPHTYSRTKAFLHQFAQSLSLADNIILTDIYAAREVDTGEISSKDLMKEIEKYNKNVVYFSTFDEVKKYLLTNCKKNDLLITMGAGDVVNIGEELLNK